MIRANVFVFILLKKVRGNGSAHWECGVSVCVKKKNKKNQNGAINGFWCHYDCLKLVVSCVALMGGM